jgi:hypothetical protein
MLSTMTAMRLVVQPESFARRHRGGHELPTPITTGPERIRFSGLPF